MKKHNPGYDFIIGLVDKFHESIQYANYNYMIILVEEIAIADFSNMVKKYNIVELNTAVKPFFFLHFLNNFNYTDIIYLDPDIEIFHPFSSLETELGLYDIVLTPHFTTPISDDKWQQEEDFLNSGIFNLGFLAVKNTPNVLTMLTWWSERTKNKAFISFHQGLFTDQIWMNFVPLFFENVLIARNPGYNVAYWNLHERKIHRDGSQYMVNATTPLVFYHYASFRPMTPNDISLHQNRFSFEERPDIVPLFTSYRKKLLSYDYESISTIKCYYSTIHEEEKQKEKDSKWKNIIWYRRVLIKSFKLLRMSVRRSLEKLHLLND